MDSLFLDSFSSLVYGFIGFLQIEKDVFESLGLPVFALWLVEPRTLPKTSSGKIRRRKVRELIVSDSLKSILFKSLPPSQSSSVISIPLRGNAPTLNSSLSHPSSSSTFVIPEYPKLSDTSVSMAIPTIDTSQQSSIQPAVVYDNLEYPKIQQVMIITVATTYSSSNSFK